MQTPPRKGARSIKEIPPRVLAQLNAGTLATVNLVECLAVDRRRLLQRVLEAHKRQHYLPLITQRIDVLKKQSVNTISVAIGQGLYEEAQATGDTAFLQALSKHPSDIVRAWVAHGLGSSNALTLEELFAALAPFAADSHFGVREEAWMAARGRIAEQLEASLALLTPWVHDADENIRRFACEATRPRGVWCAHIPALKQHPELALPLLSPLRADPARYVQNSLANWLNDAAKTRPDFTQSLCRTWQEELPTNAATAYIIKRALRSLGK